MANYKVTDTELTALADAIREKGGTSAALEWPSGFISAVNALPSGGGEGKHFVTTTGTATPTGTANAELLEVE